MGILADVKAAPARLRRRRPAIDHLVRAYGRYAADAGDRLAASVALPGFLSFFPLLALAFFVLGFVLTGSLDTQRSVLDATRDYIPGLLCSSKVPGFACASGQIDIAELGKARAGAGVIGVVGLLITGTGWVDALRAGLRSVWHQNVLAGNVILVKLWDTLILAGLGVALLASIAVSGVTNSATSFVLDQVGLEGSVVGNIGVKLIGYVVSIAVNVALFLFLFAVLPKVQTPIRKVVRGALLAAVGFLVLQLLGAVYIKHTTGNPVYGTFAAIIGLLIWINVICRFTLFCAAWTVTAPYDSDVAPSGTSSPELAEQAGLPREYAGGGPDDPATTVGGGAPSPLRAAVQGRAPSQADDPGEQAAAAQRATEAAPPVAPTDGGRAGRRGSAGRRAWAAGATAATPPGRRKGRALPAGATPAATGGNVPHAGAARAAGRVGVGLVAVGSAGVVTAALRHLRDVVRSTS